MLHLLKTGPDYYNVVVNIKQLRFFFAQYLLNTSYNVHFKCYKHEKQVAKPKNEILLHDHISNNYVSVFGHHLADITL